MYKSPRIKKTSKIVFYQTQLIIFHKGYINKSSLRKSKKQRDQGLDLKHNKNVSKDTEYSAWDLNPEQTQFLEKFPSL